MAKFGDGQLDQRVIWQDNVPNVVSALVTSELAGLVSRQLTLICQLPPTEIPDSIMSETAARSTN
jgi:hypothetical protein